MEDMRLLARAAQKGAEKKFGVPADYIRQLGETSTTGFLKFLFFLPLAAHRRKLPLELAHAARITASRHEDCGTCVQIAVNVAAHEGMSASFLEAVLEERTQDLPQDVVLVMDFTKAVLRADGSEEALREGLESRLGPTEVTELCLAIATARVFPTVKRGLGFAKSCSLVSVRVAGSERDQV
jgi:alkylhydroperoxidase family enzyme